MQSVWVIGGTRIGEYQLEGGILPHPILSDVAFLTDGVGVRYFTSAPIPPLRHAEGVNICAAKHRFGHQGELYAPLLAGAGTGVRSAGHHPTHRGRR